MEIRINRQSQSLQSGRFNRRGAIGCGLLIPLFIGAIFGIVGLCLVIFWGLPVLNQAKASEQWPSAKGTISSSEVIRSRSDDGVQYRPEVLYSYQVDGEEYGQGTIRFDGDWSTNDSTYSNKMVKKYPAGMQVDVFYDPEDPYEAVLEPGVTWGSYSALGFGMIFFLVGAGIFMGTGGYLLFAMFIAGRTASSRTGRSSSSQDCFSPQDRYDDKNPYANTDAREDNNQDDYDSRDHDDGFENL